VDADTLRLLETGRFPSAKNNRHGTEDILKFRLLPGKDLSDKDQMSKRIAISPLALLLVALRSPLHRGAVGPIGSLPKMLTQIQMKQTLFPSLPRRSGLLLPDRMNSSEKPLGNLPPSIPGKGAGTFQLRKILVSLR
jgi:hypothetical protein